MVALGSGNRSFSLEKYATALTNTVLAEAHNAGAMTRYASSGTKFVQVIERESAPDAACGFMRSRMWRSAIRGCCRRTPELLRWHPPLPRGSQNPIMSVDDRRIPAEVKKMMARKADTMEKPNRIVLKELVERHKESRLLAMGLRDEMHEAALASRAEGDTTEPEKLNHKDNEVLDALYAELRDNGDAHPTCVAKYDEAAKQYTKHNG